MLKPNLRVTKLGILLGFLVIAAIGTSIGAATVFVHHARLPVRTATSLPCAEVQPGFPTPPAPFLPRLRLRFALEPR